VKTMESSGMSKANNAPTAIRKSNLHCEVKFARVVANW